MVQRCAQRATRCKIRNAKQIKFRASQKQRSDFLAAPIHKAPPGRQKSECEFCLFGVFFLRPARRAMCRAGRSCAACRCYAGFLRPVPVCLPCVLCAQFRLVLAVCLPVLRCLHAHFSLIFRLFLFGFLPLKLLFICRSCRDGHPIFFSERKWGKRTARGAARRSPSNPIPAPCGQSPLFSRCWPA